MPVLILPQILAVVVGGHVVDVHLITFLFQWSFQLVYNMTTSQLMMRGIFFSYSSSAAIMLLLLIVITNVGGGR